MPLCSSDSVSSCLTYLAANAVQKCGSTASNTTIPYGLAASLATVACTSTNATGLPYQLMTG